VNRLRQHPKIAFAAAALLIATGERDVGEIFIGVDEPERLVQALSEPP